MATVELTEENFEQTILNNDIVIIDFWADWCAPCKAFAPTYEAVSTDHPDVIFGKVDTQAHPSLAQTFNIRGIPNLMIFREQIAIFQEAGSLPAEALTELLQQVRDIDMSDVRTQIAAAAAPAAEEPADEEPADDA